MDAGYVFLANQSMPRPLDQVHSLLVAMNGLRLLPKHASVVNL